MSQEPASHVVADYGDGVLTPLEPLDLPEKTRVDLTVKVLDDDAADARLKAEQAAWRAYRDHLVNGKKYHFAGLWDRDALYDRF